MEGAGNFHFSSTNLVIITVDLYSAYFVRNFNHAECASRSRRVYDFRWRLMVETERLLSARLIGSEFQMELVDRRYHEITATKHVYCCHNKYYLNIYYQI